MDAEKKGDSSQVKLKRAKEMAKEARMRRITSSLFKREVRRPESIIPGLFSTGGCDGDDGGDDDDDGGGDDDDGGGDDDDDDDGGECGGCGGD